jgi:ABC-2 type transport system permease protein
MTDAKVDPTGRSFSDDWEESRLRRSALRETANRELMRTIYILWIRQLKRYARSRARIIASLGQPLLFLLGLGFGMGPVFQKAGQGSYIQFLAPGIVGMTLLFTSVFSGMELIWDRQFGFLKETLVAPVPRLLIMVGRTLGGATVAIIQGSIVILICLVAGFRPAAFVLLPLTFLFMVLISVMFTAMGTAIATRLADFQGFQLIINLLVMPMFFLSGALFPLRDLPGPMAVITSINPLSFGVDGLRYTLSGSAHFSLAMDLGILVGLTVGLLVLGGYLFSRIEL